MYSWSLKQKKIVSFILAALLLILPRCGHIQKKQEPRQETENQYLEKELDRQYAVIDRLNRRIDRLDMDISRLKKRDFTILLTGDILLDRMLTNVMVEADRKYPFERIAQFIDKYDLVFANLETPITVRDDPDVNKPYSFRLLPVFAYSLSDISLDIVSLANNHILDHGADGMRETIFHLEDMGIEHSGAGENIEEATRPACFNFGSADVYFLSYCERPPAEFYAGTEKPGTANVDSDAMRETIKRYKKDRNVVIVSLHWGIEQTSTPRPNQRALAKSLIDAGADIIVGHHPHWPQGIEVYRKKPIIYSLGNFVNGFLNVIEKDNIFVALHYSDGKLGTVEVIPVAGKNTEIRFQPFILEGDDAEKHLEEIQKLCLNLKTTMVIKNSRGYIKF